MNPLLWSTRCPRSIPKEKLRVNLTKQFQYASDQWEKSQKSTNNQLNLWGTFGHQEGICHHVGAAIVVVWHCMGI